MKKIISSILISVILLTSCSSVVETDISTQKINAESSVSADVTQVSSDELTSNESSETTLVDLVKPIDIPDSEMGDSTPYVFELDYEEMDDAELLSYIEDQVYFDLVNTIDTDTYYVDSVSAIYISQEYIDELEYNSRKNVYFGYTLDELDAYFENTKYVFTIEDGKTVAKPFESYDDTYDKMIRNVAIGTGVILVCVVVCVVSEGAAVPAVASIFAAAAKGGAIGAVSGGLINGVATGAVTGIQTGDMDAALKAGALAGSEGYMWGAIAGAATGGFSEYMNLSKMAVNDLSLNDVAKLEKLGWSPEAITSLHNMEEAQVLIDAGLKGEMINGKLALIRYDIDINLLDEYGRSNLERMKAGLSPIGYDEFGNIFKFELHHIGQEADAPLAILTQAEHDNAALHGFKEISEINRSEFDKIRQNFWKTMATVLESKGK